MGFGLVSFDAQKNRSCSKNLTRCEQKMCNERKSVTHAMSAMLMEVKAPQARLDTPYTRFHQITRQQQRFCGDFLFLAYQEGAATSSSEIQSLGDGADPGSGGRTAVLLARNACDLLVVAAAMA